MYSLIAALKTLVLPFGATSGGRMILDGVNGLIEIFNSSGVLAITIAPTTGTDSFGNTYPSGIDVLQGGAIKVIGNLSVSTGSAQESAVGVVGATNFNPGGGTETFETFIASPSHTGTNLSSIAVISDSVDGTSSLAEINLVTNTLRLTGVATTCEISSDGGGAFAGIVKCRNSPVQTVAGFSSDTNPSGTTSGTTELVVDTVTANVKSGVTYEITHFSPWNFSIATDSFDVRIREDSLTGNILQRARYDSAPVLNELANTITAIFTAGTDATKTFKLTAARATGTGTAQRRATSVFTVKSLT